MLGRKQFQVRYKRASLGVLWAVAVPGIQAAVLALVFSHFVHNHQGYSYPAYVVAGVFGWSYFGQTLGLGATAIVDNSSLADKLWFPRSILVIAECLAALPGLLISMVLLLVLLPIFGVGYAPHTLFLIPAMILLVCFCAALTLCLSALHVYFRDVRYMIQASLLVLFYITPVAYPQRRLGGLGRWLDVNPLTGLTNMFHLAAVGRPGLWATDLTRSVAVTAGVTIIMVAAAIEVHRRHDRLFVDLL